jgi:hypothetical protein
MNQEQKITHVTVPVELVNDIVNYLADRPWREVNDMQQGLFRAANDERARMAASQEKTE